MDLDTSARKDGVQRRQSHVYVYTHVRKPKSALTGRRQVASARSYAHADKNEGSNRAPAKGRGAHGSAAACPSMAPNFTRPRKLGLSAVYAVSSSSTA